MDFIHITAAVLSLAAAFSYINHRFIGLPTTIGVMLIALALSGGLLLSGHLGLGNVRERAALCSRKLILTRR